MSRNKKAKHSKDSLYPLFEEYAKSEEGRMSFCERHGIGLHNYNYWWAKYREEKGLTKLSKNKGRKKGSSKSTELKSTASPNLATSADSTTPYETGAFIKMADNIPSQNSSLRLRTIQGIELRFEQLPPVSYLQQLLNLTQKP